MLATIFLFVSKIVLSKLYSPLIRRYAKIDPEHSPQQIEKYHHNAVNHAFNATQYIILVAFSVKAVAGKPWLPWWLCGSGDGTQVFANFPFIETDEEVFYVMLLSLSIPLLNMFELLFISQHMPDFAEMLLHHICHLSLIFTCLASNLT